MVSDAGGVWTGRADGAFAGGSGEFRDREFHGVARCI